jgi:predicted nucleic acid-binding protein
VLVFDTSAYLNGWHDHYPPSTFPSVWELVAEAMDDGRIIAPREVLTELRRKDDDVCEWANRRVGDFVEADADVQRRAGEIYRLLPNPGVRDDADPFVIAEAEIRSFTVVTYEGRSFSGIPHARWERTMPGICQHLGVSCRTLPESLTMLGARF